MIYNIQTKLENIKRNGNFTRDQLRVIEFAMGIVGINEDLIINPEIPSEYMSMYIRLMIRGIDVRKYIIQRNWELKEITVFDVEKTIIAENQSKQDIITPNSNSSIFII